MWMWFLNKVHIYIYVPYIVLLYIVGYVKIQLKTNPKLKEKKYFVFSIGKEMFDIYLNILRNLLDNFKQMRNWNYFHIHM